MPVERVTPRNNGPSGRPWACTSEGSDCGARSSWRPVNSWSMSGSLIRRCWRVRDRAMYGLTSGHHCSRGRCSACRTRRDVPPTRAESPASPVWKTCCRCIADGTMPYCPCTPTRRRGPWILHQLLLPDERGGDRPGGRPHLSGRRIGHAPGIKSTLERPPPALRGSVAPERARMI